MGEGRSLKSFDEFVSIKNMENSMLQRDLSETTYINYKWAVKDFTEKTGFENPDQLIAAVNGEVSKALELIKRYIDAYRPKQFNGQWKKPRRSLHTHIGGIKKFFRSNGIELFAESVRDLMPRAKRQYQPRPTSREVLQKLCDNLALRGKVVLCLASGSGLRMGTILKLQLKDIVFNDPDSIQGEWLMKIPYTTLLEDEVLKKMKGASSDDKRIHYIFATPECVEYLKDYLAYRERKGEKLTPESPLITVEREGSRWNEKYGDFLSYFSAWDELNKAMLTVGLREKGKRGLHPHSFRAFFRTQLAISGIDDPTSERLMAHEGGYLESSYFAPQMKILRDAFVQALPFIEIRGTMVTPEQLRKQGVTIERQKAEIEALKSKLDEISIHAQSLSYQTNIFMQLMKLQYPDLEERLKKFETLSPEERNKIIEKLLRGEQK